MIEIRVNDELLALYPDTQIAMEEENPIFVRQYIPSTHSLPFTVPRLGNNKILGALAEQDTDDRYKVVFATISFAGDTIYSGSIQVLSSNRDSYKIIFSTKAEEYQDIELRDLDLGGIRNVTSFGNKTMPPYNAPYNYPEKDYYLAPVKNKKIEDLLPTDSVEYLHATNFGYQYSFKNGGPQFADRWYNPAPYVFAVLDKALSVDRVGTFFTDAEMAQLVLVNPVWVRELNNLSVLSQHTTTDNFDLVAHVPDKKLSELLNVLAEYFCAVTFFNKEGQLQMDLLKDLPADDIVDVTEQVDGYGTTEYVETDGYNIKHTRPADDQMYEDTLGAPSGTYLGEYDTVSGLPNQLLQGDAHAIIREDGHYYQYTSAAGWTKHAYAYLDDSTDGAEDIEVDACTVIMEESQWPITDQEIKRTVAILDRHSFGFRFAFARGLQIDPTYGLYNLLTSDSWSGNGTTIGNYSLRISGESGTRSVFWERFLRFRNDVVHTRQVRLSLPAAQLAYHQLVRIGNQVYTWRRKKYSLTMHGISVVTLELYKR